ncbi:MAG: hypothetical protein EKK61_00065 [Rickettsiales bacterium]|nr:MAG: hypothetical protein EKK61_00065 [Rickettsiales bacterium]
MYLPHMEKDLLSLKFDANQEFGSIRINETYHETRKNEILAIVNYLKLLQDQTKAFLNNNSREVRIQLEKTYESYKAFIRRLGSAYIVVPSHIMDLPFNDYISVVTRKNEEEKTELLTEVKSSEAEILTEQSKIETSTDQAPESDEETEKIEEVKTDYAPNKLNPRSNRFKKKDESK